MRKRSPSKPSSDHKSAWLDLEQLAEVSVTSEDVSAPVEGAFVGGSIGWRAAIPGQQALRLFFDSPQNLRLIEVLFVEEACERSQEFVLRWRTEVGPLHEIVRQQFCFSPAGAVRELESYTVSLTGVRMLELEITPDRNGGNVLATLARLRAA